MMKPPGMDEWDPPMPKVPKDRKPLTKEEEEKIGAELRENIRKIVEKSGFRKEPLYEKNDKNRKIG